ncbi:MAG: Secretion system C-terminal sorting domain [Bacteroidota bacterium]|jgi:hypothetical protein
MLKIKNIILIALCLLGHPIIFGQCQQYNLNISYDKQAMHVTPELSHNGAFTYKGIWYTDSIAVDQKKYTRNTSPAYKCLIIKYNNSGDVVAQIDLILPFPITNPNLRLDPSNGGLAYALTAHNQIYKINNSLSVDATNKSVIGIVRIDSNLSSLQFVKIGETTNKQRIWQGENDIYCTKTGATMLMIVDKPVYLNNGDSIKPSSVIDVYSLLLDNKFNVTKKNLLAQNSSNVRTYGMLNTPIGFYYFIKYSANITVSSTKQTYSNALRKLLPGSGFDGYDFLVIKEVNNRVESSYTIGCPSTVEPIGMTSRLFYANERFYFPHNNAGQMLCDNTMRQFITSTPERNALAIFDTAFRLTNLKAFDDKSEYTSVRTGFFASSPNEFTLTASTDSAFTFNGSSYTPQKKANPTFMNVIYSVKGDSIYYKWSQQTENHMCFFSDLSGQSATFNLYPYPGKVVASVNNMTLKKPLYKEHFWITKICLPDLRSQDIETTLPRCYPNPLTQGVLQVDATQPIQSIVVMTMQGQVVFEQSPNAAKTAIDLKYLPVGNYLVKTQLTNQSNTQKIIVLN